MNDSKKFKLSWQQIIPAIIIFVITGTLGFISGDLAEALKRPKRNEKSIERLELKIDDVSKDFEVKIEKEIKPAIEGFGQTNEEIQIKLGQIEATQRRLEIMINRVDAVVNRLEKVTSGISE
jgi:hypothetical protein